MVEMAVESHGASLLLSWHETCLGSVFGLRLAIGRARASARASHSLRESDSLFLSVKTKIGLSAYFYFHGGDGESRTRVRKHFRETFSERSQCFFTSLQPASIDRHKPQLSRYSPVLPGTRAEFSCIFDAGLQGLQVNLSRHAQLMTD